MLRKLFPGGFSNSPYNSFKLILVAEDYPANETAHLLDDGIAPIEAFIGLIDNGTLWWVPSRISPRPPTLPAHAKIGATPPDA